MSRASCGHWQEYLYIHIYEYPILRNQGEYILAAMSQKPARIGAPALGVIYFS